MFACYRVSISIWSNNRACDTYTNGTCMKIKFKNTYIHWPTSKRIKWICFFSWKSACFGIFQEKKDKNKNREKNLNYDAKLDFVFLL